MLMGLILRLLTPQCNSYRFRLLYSEGIRVEKGSCRRLVRLSMGMRCSRSMFNIIK